MAEHKRTPREIEREVEHERAELRGTVEELFNRFTFEDAWNRVGAYMRDNRSDFGHSFGRVVKEKPLAVALTAVGVGWLLFGPAQPPPRVRARGRGTPPGRYGRDDHARTRAMLEKADFADRSARGPSSPDAQPDLWEAPSRTPAAAQSTTSSEARAGQSVAKDRWSPTASGTPGDTGAVGGPSPIAGSTGSGASQGEPGPSAKPEPVHGGASAAPSPGSTKSTTQS